jgi:hypothetical protein
MTGQDRTGQDRTGQDGAGQTGHRTGQGRAGQGRTEWCGIRDDRWKYSIFLPVQLAFEVTEGNTDKKKR